MKTHVYERLEYIFKFYFLLHTQQCTVTPLEVWIYAQSIYIAAMNYEDHVYWTFTFLCMHNQPQDFKVPTLILQLGQDD